MYEEMTMEQINNLPKDEKAEVKARIKEDEKIDDENDKACDEIYEYFHTECKLFDFSDYMNGDFDENCELLPLSFEMIVNEIKKQNPETTDDEVRRFVKNEYRDDVIKLCGTMVMEQFENAGCDVSDTSIRRQNNGSFLIGSAENCEIYIHLQNGIDGPCRVTGNFAFDLFRNNYGDPWSMEVLFEIYGFSDYINALELYTNNYSSDLKYLIQTYTNYIAAKPQIISAMKNSFDKLVSVKRYL